MKPAAFFGDFDLFVQKAIGNNFRSVAFFGDF